jgi:hypothetical protein
MDISSAASSSSTWKLNNPKAISKPPVLAEADPVKLEMGSTVVITGGLMANTGVDSMMVGDAVSTTVDAVMSTMVVGEVVPTTVGAAMPTMVGDAVSMSMPMADDATSMSVSMVVGEGAGESVDPDPVVPTVGAN